MQPTDQMSIAFVYSAHESMTSGARYHRVATYSVINPAWFCSGSATRASPKSQILRSQFELRRMFEGFRSRWMTCAEWMNLSPRRIWYTKYCAWSSDSGCGDEMI
eukprot:Amastigsp_a1887_57.p7 type:complete len:105 gc:universal Amastigsp_a1887_57:571-885(+)